MYLKTYERQRTESKIEQNTTIQLFETRGGIFRIRLVNASCESKQKTFSQKQTQKKTLFLHRIAFPSKRFNEGHIEVVRPARAVTVFHLHALAAPENVRTT